MKLGFEITESAKEVLFNPTETLTKIIEDDSFIIQKKHFIFTVLMNVYYLFVPSTLLAVHIFAPLFAMVSCGVMYHFAERASVIYQEEGMKGINDNKFFYKIAYCFALANIPGLLFAIVHNIISFVYAGNFFLGLLYAFFLNIFWFIAAIFYPLIMMSVISRKKWDVVGVTKLMIQSSLITIKEFLGYKAVKELIADYKDL